MGSEEHERLTVSQRQRILRKLNPQDPRYKVAWHLRRMAVTAGDAEANFFGEGHKPSPDELLARRNWLTAPRDLWWIVSYYSPAAMKAKNLAEKEAKSHAVPVDRWCLLCLFLERAVLDGDINVD